MPDTDSTAEQIRRMRLERAAHLYAIGKLPSPKDPSPEQYAEWEEKLRQLEEEIVREDLERS